MIELLLKRRSVVANKLGDPGPSPAELRNILISAARVPDHKKLVPWRFVLFQGEARRAFGDVLRAACAAEENEPSAARLEIEQMRFTRAPIIVAVISRVRQVPGVPEWEQILSAGAACQNALVAAAALGFSAQWITEWYGYSPAVTKAMGLGAGEKVAGFIYIGSAQEPPEERERPDLDAIVTRWSPEAQPEVGVDVL